MTYTIKKNNFVLIGIGIIMGILLFNSWMIFYFLLCIASILLYYYFLKEDQDRELVIKFLFVALISRLIVGVILHAIVSVYGNGIDIFGDGMAYVFKGRMISNIISGEISVLRNPALTDYQTTIWAYILGVLFRIFGFQPIIGKMINMLLGALSGINFYFITSYLINKELERKTKIIALTIFLFFPSLFLWSLSNIRDSTIIYLLSLFVLFILRYQRNNFLFIIAPLFISIITYLFRPVLFYPLLLLIFLAILIKFVCHKNFLFRIATITILCSLTLIFLHILVGFSIKDTIAKFSIMAVAKQLGHINSGGTAYYVLPMHYYNNIHNLHLTLFDSSILFFKGWIHMLLEPFPFRMRTVLALSSYGQMILWYFLLFFSAYGIIISLQVKKFNSLIMISYITVIGTMIAMNGANVGTTLRLRDMISPFLLIFSIIGLQRFFPIKKCHL